MPSILLYLFYNFILSFKIVYTFSNNLFYAYGPDNFNNLLCFDKFLIFYADYQLENLENYEVRSIDGTIQVMPKTHDTN